MPTSTNKPCSAAMSSSQRGGGVYVRNALKPLFAIAAKSLVTTDAEG